MSVFLPFKFFHVIYLITLFSDEKDQLWVWEYSDDDSGGTHDMKMEVGERIRFKVREEMFRDTTPSGPTTVDTVSEGSKKVCYSLVGSCSEAGLGLISWWM